MDVISVPQDVRYVVDFWLIERGEEDQRGLELHPSPFRGNTMDVISVHIPLQVRTLRGHESEIVSAVVMSGRGGGGDVDWENPAPPVVVSLSDDGCVKAWDVMQVRKYIHTCF